MDQSKYITVENLHLDPTTQLKKGFISWLENLEDTTTFGSKANNIVVKYIIFKVLNEFR